MIFSHAVNNILQTDLCFYHQLRKVCWKTAFVQDVENVLKLHTKVQAKTMSFIVKISHCTTTSELRANQKNEIFISYLLVPDEYLNVLWSKGLIMCKNQETGIC